MSERRARLATGAALQQVAAEHVLLRETLVELFNATAYMEHGGKREAEAIGRAREVLRAIPDLAATDPQT